MDGGDVAVEGGEVQRAVAMRVGGEVTCTRLEQRPHHRRVAGVAAHDQWCLTWLGLGLGLGSGLALGLGFGSGLGLGFGVRACAAATWAAPACGAYGRPEGRRGDESGGVLWAA